MNANLATNYFVFKSRINLFFILTNWVICYFIYFLLFFLGGPLPLPVVSEKGQGSKKRHSGIKGQGSFAAIPIKTFSVDF